MINRGCNRSAIVDSWSKLREEGTVCRIYPSPMKELSMAEHVKKKGFSLQVEKVYEKEGKLWSARRKVSAMREVYVKEERLPAS